MRLIKKLLIGQFKLEIATFFAFVAIMYIFGMQDLLFAALKFMFANLGSGLVN